jgi:hypothetical protein
MHAKVVMRKNRRLSRISEARLEEMTEQAVDAYSESERITGWFTMIKENLGVPFETTVPRDNQGENRATIRMRKAPGMG